MVIRYIIIRRKKRQIEVNFWWLYKITVSIVLTMPHLADWWRRTVTASPSISKINERQFSSRFHMPWQYWLFSHFWFWFLRAPYLVLRPCGIWWWVLYWRVIAVFLPTGTMVLYRIQRRYHMRMVKILRHFPGAKRNGRNFIEKHQEKIDTMNRQIATCINRTDVHSYLLYCWNCRVSSAALKYSSYFWSLCRRSIISGVLILVFTSLLPTFCSSFHTNRWTRRWIHDVTTGLDRQPVCGYFCRSDCTYQRTDMDCCRIITIKLDK